MYQTAREAAEALSTDFRSSAHQDTFEKALSISLKDRVLRTEAALLSGRMEEFHQLCNFQVPLGARVNRLPDIECRDGCLSRPLSIHFCPMGSPPCLPSIISIDQLRPATFQLPQGTAGELCRLAQDIGSDLISQPWPPIYCETIASTNRSNYKCPSRKLMNRIMISTSASFVRSVRKENIETSLVIVAGDATWRES
jgi:hypothetical protein